MNQFITQQRRRACIAAAACVTALLLANQAAAAGDAVAPHTGIEDQVLTAQRAAAAPANVPAPVPPSAATTVLTGSLDLSALPQATAPVEDTTSAEVESTTPSVTHTSARAAAGAVNGAPAANPDGLTNTPAAADPLRTFVYTEVPAQERDGTVYNDRLGHRGFDATFGMAAGTGGMMQTYGSVTFPLLDNRLSVRISGAKGSGYPYGGSGGSGTFGPGSVLSSGDSSSIGLDVLWTPTDNVRISAQSSRNSGSYRYRNK